MAIISYARAIRDAYAQLLESDPRVFAFGQGLWSPWYVGQSMKDLDLDFGKDRIIDSPVSENATTGAAVGAALMGMRPIVSHPRMDFMVLAIDPIINQAANWSYMFDGKQSVPITIRGIINRGGEQGAQHSQALQAFFAHVPGVKVVMPATPYDAKGMFISAVRDDNPVMFIDDRWLYDQEAEVPSEMYEVPIGEAAILREGSDVTVISSSYMTRQATKAASKAAERGIDVEIVDLRTVSPWDVDRVCESVRKTGRAVVADSGWRSFGVAAEIAATVGELCFDKLESPIRRVCLPDAPAPSAPTLEAPYYDHIGVDSLLEAIEQTRTAGD